MIKRRAMWILLGSVVIMSSAVGFSRLSHAPEQRVPERLPSASCQELPVPVDSEPRARNVGFEKDAQIKRLREELRRKDEELAAAQKIGVTRQESFLAARAEAQAEAMRILDVRIFEKQDDRATARLTAEMGSVVQRLVPNDVEREVLCGSEMCRVALTGNPQNLGQTIEALVDESGKRFGASTVLPTEDNQITIYFAPENEYLRTSPVPQGSQNAAVQGVGSVEAEQIDRTALQRVDEQPGMLEKSSQGLD